MDNESYFGLGHVNRQGKIGNYQLTLSHASVDNERADMFLSENMSASKASSMTVKKIKLMAGCWEKIRQLQEKCFL
ncbi:hypothetical protein AB6H14_04780 [Providencia vermicola]